jgi:hypothetical protein
MGRRIIKVVKRSGFIHRWVIMVAMATIEPSTKRGWGSIQSQEALALSERSLGAVAPRIASAIRKNLPP